MTPPRRSTAGSSEGPSWVGARGHYLGPLVLTELPAEVPFGFLRRVVPAAEGDELRMEVHRIPDETAVTLVEGADANARTELGVGESSGDATQGRLERESESARGLARQLAHGETELWRVGLVFVAVGRSPRTVDRLREALGRRLGALGFRTRVPRFDAARALAAPSLTGAEERPAGYWHTLSSDGVAAFFPFGDEGLVESGGTLVGLALEDASPVFLDRFRHASHSWGIFGQTGSGKSFAAALDVLRSRWRRPDLTVTIVDPLGEFGRIVRSLGGQVVSLGGRSNDHLNPLDLATTDGDRSEKAIRVAAFLRALWPSLTDEEAARIDAAVASLFRERSATPTLSELAERLSGSGRGRDRVSDLLEVFRLGSLAGLDRPSTVVARSSLTSFDLSAAAEEHRPFHLAYALDWVYGRMRATDGPKLVVVDEAHLLAAHGPTAAFFDRLVRHGRHFGAGLLVLSQNPDDFLTSESGRSLLRNLRATLLLRLPEVSESTRRFFGLTDAESTWLPRARLPREAGYSEGLLRFGPTHLPIALVASTPEYEFLSSGLENASTGAAETARLSFEARRREL